MIANYQQPGSAIDYPNGTSSAIAAGQVVSLTTRIGVAGTDIRKRRRQPVRQGRFCYAQGGLYRYRHRRRRLLRRLRRQHHHDRCKQHPRRLGYCSSR